MHILIDIGATKTRIAGTADGERFGEPRIFDTPQEYDAALALIADTAREIAAGETPASLVAGLPVLLEPGKRVIADSQHLPLWSGKPFAEDVERALGAHAILENDAALVGLGEAVYGAGKGVRSLMYLTVSTGVNGVHIQGGKLDPAYLGVSIGRQYVTMEEPPVIWEELISGTSLIRRHGKHPKELGKGWPGWEELARTVAFGVHNSILHWMPERVVLGGSMFNEIGISVERVRFHAEAIRSGIPALPEIVHAGLGDIGGLWGALAHLGRSR